MATSGADLNSIERNRSRGSSASDPDTGIPVPRKTRTGCSTCKIRKVKCGEEKPDCFRCTSTGRKCPGYSSPRPAKARLRKSKYDLGEPLLDQSIHRVPASVDRTEQINERRSLYYLHHRASDDISAYFEEGFWRLSIQASQAEPCIHHALVAISSFYESHELSQTPAVPTFSDRSDFLTTFALQQYTKAVGLLSKDTGTFPPNHQAVLLACLIFIWFELLQDNLDIALRHLRSGLLILSRHLEAPVPNGLDSAVVRLFIRLHTEATLHGSPTTDFDPNEIMISAGNEAFTSAGSMSICEARSCLDRQLNETFRFHRKIERPGFVKRCLTECPYPDELSLESMCQMQLDGLVQWRATYHNLERTTTDDIDNNDRISLFEMELQYLIATNTLTTLFATTPMIYDSYTADFARMVYLVRQIMDGRRRKRLFTLPLDSGLLAPLFYICLKCRDLGIRREANVLLHECQEREGMWDRAVIAEMVEWKFAKEEQSRTWLGLSEQDPLPEDARIYCEKPRLRVIDGQQVTVVSYKRGPYGGIGDIEPDEEEVTSLGMRLAAVLGT